MECGLDGTGRLLDVGCGPGVLAVELAALFDEAVGLDPDADMLTEAVHHAERQQTTNVRWVRGLAEQLPDLDLGGFRLVTFGLSFHRTDRERVAETVYDLLEPGGSIALVAHAVDGRPRPEGPGYPKIPHEAIGSLIDKYLGPRRRSGQGFVSMPPDRWQDALGRTRFGRGRQRFAPGRADIVQDIDGVLANYLSMSFRRTPSLRRPARLFRGRGPPDAGRTVPVGALLGLAGRYRDRHRHQAEVAGPLDVPVILLGGR